VIIPMRMTYFSQALALVGGLGASILIVITASRGNYWLVIINTILVAVNITTFIINIKTRKRMRNGFTKTAQCSCGACDWGTVIRQYDEVPVCRNCWATWKGK